MNFSESALNKLMTSFPDLGKLVVSFRDMKGDMDERSTTDMGVFILRSGGKQFYIPVISQSGTVYPIDSVFDAQEQKFFPLSKNTVDVILDVQKMDLGKAQKTPHTVNKNPSVQDLVVPPKTGKNVYASNGRLPEFLATIPGETKAALLEKIAADLELSRGLNKVYGISEILEPLKKEASVPVQTAVATEAPARVITEGKNLSEEEIQDILNKGYTIQGTHANPRVAIMSDMETYKDSFTQIRGAKEGAAYEVVFRDGTTRQAIVPKRLARSGTAQNVKNTPPRVVIFNNATYAKVPHDFPAVIRNDEVNYRTVMSDILEHSGSMNLDQVEAGNKYAVFDGSTLVGIFYVDNVVSNDTFLNLSVREEGSFGRSNIQVEKAMTSAAFREGDDVVAGSGCIAIPVCGCIYPERLESSLTAACRRREFMDAHLLEGSMTIGHSHGEFSADSTPVGGKPAIIRILVEKKKILPEAAESFVKAAEERGYVKVLMTKQAMYKKASTTRAEHPEYGEKPAPSIPISGDKHDRALGSTKAVGALKESLKSGDKQVVDATLISELLQDPDLHDTIESYLPEIAEAIDKIGRILLITRMKVDDLAEKMNSASLTDLLTSLRNTYRTLGDNYVKLERLSANVSTES